MNTITVVCCLVLGIITNSWAKSVVDEVNNVYCSSVFQQVGDHCLFVDESIVGNWQSMRDLCQELGGDLPNLKDANFLADINKYLGTHYGRNQNYWVGSNDHNAEGVWQWGNDNSQVKLGTPLWGDNSAREQDPRGGFDQNCGAIMKGDFFYMHDEQCTQSYALLCEQFTQLDDGENDNTTPWRYSTTTSGPAVCPSPYEVIHGKCLFVNTLVKNNWHSHKISCESMGGHMVKLDDANFFGSVYDHLVQGGIHGDFWIGASDEQTETNWFWHDGSMVRVSTPFWGNNGEGIQNPDGGVIENCAMLKEIDHYFFNDDKCDNDHFVICQIDL